MLITFWNTKGLVMIHLCSLFLFFVEYTQDIRDALMSKENMSNNLLQMQPLCPVAGGLRDSAYSGQLCLSIWACGPEANMSDRILGSDRSVI